MKRSPLKVPLKITLIYLTVGILWILISDQLLIGALEVQDWHLSHLQTLKGGFYVLFTSLMLYLLVKRYYLAISSQVSELEKLNKDLSEVGRAHSHDLRGPLSRLLGLVDVLQNYEKFKRIDKSKEQLTEEVKEAALELDAMLRKVNQQMEKNRHNKPVK